MARARPRLAITALLVASLSLTATAAFNRFDITLPDKCTGGPCAWEHIYRGYAAWHNATTRDPFACGGAKVLVWRPIAGLGDSLLAMAQAVTIAIKMGRLFFVDWSQPHGGWSVGLALPSADRADWGSETPSTWNWDWTTYRCRSALEAAASAFVSDAQHPRYDGIAIIPGSVTADNWVLSEADGRALQWAKQMSPPLPASVNPRAAFDNIIPRRHFVAGRVIRPSAAVLEALGSAYDELNDNYVVGLQIRTGSQEGCPFLSPGDEQQFFDCYEALQANHDLPPHHRLLIVTDNPDILSRAGYVYSDTIVDVWEGPVEHSLVGRSQSKAGLLKAFTDLFALSLADLWFLTNNSLFGRAAAEVGDEGGGGEEDRFYINDSACGRAGHARCVSPPVPPICKVHTHSLAEEEL